MGWWVRGRALLFVDDTLVFCEPSPDQLTYLSWLLIWFEALSRLRVNLEKSELILMESGKFGRAGLGVWLQDW